MDISGWRYTVINATGVTLIMSGPCVYGGYKVLAAAGAHTMDIHDSKDASGQRVATAISVAAAADQEYTVGIACKNGLAAVLSGDPTDAMILVRWR